MTTPSNGVVKFPVEAQPPAPMSATEPMYWSVRRELWENRSIYIAPMIGAAVVLFGYAMSTIGMPARRRATLLLDPEKQRAVISQPYDVAGMILIITALLVGIFYCVDALYSDRRDRSILFWKSLPVSDLTTVLSKASIPMVILPVLTFITIVATQFFMLLMTTAVLFRSGLASTTWTRFNLFTDSLILLYGMITLALWHAPIYAWLLLVSAWAKRATLLWAVLPLLAIGGLERIAFGSSHFGALLRYRLAGGIGKAFTFKPDHVLNSLTQLTPGRFLTTPGLWIGLILAAAFIATAVRLRRNREPM